MLNLPGNGYRLCDGITRRGFIKASALGVGGLSLADLLRIKAEAAVRPTSLKSIIMVYLHGGPSQLDMFDMKPDAPVEFRGEFRPIRTPAWAGHLRTDAALATIADQYSVIRNITFNEYTDGHNPPLVYTGYRNSTANPSLRPTFGSVVSRLRGDAVPDMPPYVAFDGYDPKTGRNADYLGVSHRPFVPGDEQGSFRLSPGVTPARMANRTALMRAFDGVRRELDVSGGNIAAMDAFHARAMDMIVSSRAVEAFDVSREPAAVRAMYGSEGIQFLKARRLVEAGVQIVTLTANSESQTWDLAGPWDHHGGVFTGLRRMLPAFDQHLYALITDLTQRGMMDDVAVVVWGEMGRTPKINGGAGRDHWNEVGFGLVAGGGLKMGQVIGATTSRAERAVGRPYTPMNMLATLYHNVLGIDPATTLPGINGRPMYLLDSFDKITELV